LRRSYPSVPARSSGENRETPRKNPIGPEEAKEVAISFVTANARLFVGNRASAKLTRKHLAVREVITNTYPAPNSDRGRDYTVVLKQSYEGIDVFEAEARLSMTQFGEIWSVKSRIGPLHAPPTRPRLNADQAIAKVRKLLRDPAAEPDSSTQLLVYPPSRLVWRLNLLAPNFKEVLIDASTGATVMARDNIRD